MNIGIITTSRADFGLYLPLLKKIEADDSLNYYLFVGGMHTSPEYGNSYQYIEKSFKISEKLYGLPKGNSPEGIANSMGETTSSYAKIWENYQFLDLIFCLGDRFEMFAAVSSIIPFNIPIAHISGGEVTLGAIDDKFRNALTTLSTFHFTATDDYAENVKRIIGSDRFVFNVGSLGNEAALAAPLMSESEFEANYGVNVAEGFVLTTYHPETVSLNNEQYINELIEAFKEIPLQVLITLPNADTEGKLIRDRLLDLEKDVPDKVKCFENLGQLGYYSAMKHCSLMIGNTSSGIIEAGAFNKWVINVGDRQKGRLTGDNVIHVPNDRASIVKTYHQITKSNKQRFSNPYHLAERESSAEIIKQLKKHFQ